MYLDAKDLDDDNDGENGKLFSLEFITLFKKVPEEIYNKLVVLVAEYFTSFLFLSKHLPNGITGEMVNGEGVVLRDLAAYLYITTDPLLLDYSISSLGVTRDKETNRIINLKVFVLTMNVHKVDIPKGLFPPPSLTLPEEDAPTIEKTGFRDKHGKDICSNHLVILDGQCYAVVKVSEEPHSGQWALKNENNKQDLIECHWKVEIFESIPSM